MSRTTALRRWFVFAWLLGMALAPGPVQGADAGPSSVTALESSGAPTESDELTTGYVFPTPRDQFRDWAMNAAGPAAILGNLAGASWRQWVTEEPVEWGDGSENFAKRFGTGSLTTVIGETTLSLASAAMRQDPNYYRSPRTGFGPRLKHALVMTFVARKPDGRAVFSPAKTFSPFVGPVTTQTTLYPGDHEVVDGLVSGLYGLLINASWNAAREFVVKAPGWDGEPESGR